jgi:undecaprenyl-diphosphatase
MVFSSAKFSWTPLYLVLLFLISKQYKWKTFLVLAFVTLLILVSDQISVHAFKNVFERLRPCHNPELIERVRMITGCGGQYGFVSSHAVNSFALAVFVTGIINNNGRWLTFVMFLYAFLNCYSRVYLGVHYPGDVLIGAILGFAIAKLFLLAFRFTLSKMGKGE